MSPLNIDRKALATWLGQILQERFGHPFQILLENNSASMSLAESTEEILFKWDESAFFNTDIQIPCTSWRPKSEGWHSLIEETMPVPGMSELPMQLITRTETSHTVHFDMFGMIAWILSRAEEIQSKVRDEHERFPITASHAYQHGYQDRPIIDEWLHILAQVIAKQWPEIRLTQSKFELSLSHDVDTPFMYRFVTSRKMIRFLAGDLIKRKDYSLALDRWKNWRAIRNGNLQLDPYNTFDWLMTQSETRNQRSTFYFICGGTNPVYDGDYDIGHPVIRQLLRTIYDRGHVIGLHPSYDSLNEPSRIIEEAARLRTVCDQEGIHQTSFGGRMHYLRWKNPETLHAFEKAGLSHDASLGYLEMPSLRCGTCHEYPMYDLSTNQIMSLRIRPLAFMEWAVYECINGKFEISSVAMKRLKILFERVQKAGGQFSMLWHNSSFTSVAEREAYIQVLDEKL